MATTVFPVAVASSSGVNATNITATAASTQYSAAASFDTAFQPAPTPRPTG